MASPTMQDQADFLDGVIRAGKMADGNQAGERWIRLTREQTEMLLSIQHRLERMAPHEAKIKRMVTGK